MYTLTMLISVRCMQLCTGIFGKRTTVRNVFGTELIGGSFCCRIKLPGRETEQSDPSSAEVKDAWSYTSTPPICLHSVVLI